MRLALKAQRIIQCFNICIIICLLLARSAVADTEQDKLRFAPSVGFGTQYAGVLGVQINMMYEKHKLNAALGFYGLGVGYDYAVSDKISIGVSRTEILWAKLRAVHLNYYFGSTYSEGWMVGLDVYDSYSTWDGTSSYRALVSAGYFF